MGIITRENEDRAKLARDILMEHFNEGCGEVQETQVTDMLADLMHMCKEEVLDFNIALRQAQEHFKEECREEIEERQRERDGL